MKIFKLIKLALILTIIPMPITLGMTSGYKSENELYSSILKDCSKSSNKPLHKALIEFIYLDDDFCKSFNLQVEEEYEGISNSIFLNFNIENNEELVRNVIKALSYFRNKLPPAQENTEKLKKIDSVRKLFNDEKIFQDSQSLPNKDAIWINKKNKANTLF